ncbi:MAG: 1-deoxy-D-xylulose-5-phosphate synthase [Deltaproteobacteria bacterium]|nr:1-deoxy-D-xylulose-5-phosphate synthase [Deltaproteobacteria bacterium]
MYRPDIAVNSPADLKAMDLSQLKDLAARVRRMIIRTATANGGHLSGSLGAVELAIAIHRVFDSPTDRILWDVGHQAYAHKLLTGRWRQFSSLRRAGGLSGFPRISESEHDAFSTGHSSTVVSAGLGMAVGYQAAGEARRVVAVVGDGALTAGMAWEGLNQAGWMKAGLIVVLNDNGMSISKNVGALSELLGGVGNGNGGEVSARGLFRSLGFSYLGLVDGHSIPDLEDAFLRARAASGPVLVHVKTVKGKGHPAAERDPEKHHGVSPARDGGADASPPSWTSAFGGALIRAAEADPRVVAVTAAMPSGTGLAEFARRFPDRFYDVGIAEQHAVTFAAGLARAGMRPVVALYSSFLQRAYDQLVHDVCLDNLPVAFAVDRAGLVGEDGPTHHGALDLSFLRAVPNLTVSAPSDGNELADMLAAALAHDGPWAIRYPRGSLPRMPENRPPRPMEYGRARMASTGGDALILAVGSMVAPALEARDMLLAQGVEAAVVDARFVKPLDPGIVQLCEQVPRVVCVEENALSGGFSSAVAEALADARAAGVRMVRLGIEDRFVEHGDAHGLRRAQGLCPDSIARAVLSLCSVRPEAFVPRLAAGAV